MTENPTDKLNSQLVEWNNRMYRMHPTPYNGLAGMIERARSRKVLEFAQIGPQDSVLELGCEAGNLLVDAPLCRRIVGADISSAALADASRLFRTQNRAAQFVQLDGQQHLPFSRGEFGVIICSEMLEHVENPQTVLENIHEIATRDTKIVVSIPLESLKVFVKKSLHAVGLLNVLFPRIEEGQSEWHLHAFSRRKLLEISSSRFALKREKTVWGSHYVARLQVN